MIGKVGKPTERTSPSRTGIGRRERVRAATREEIKSIALRQLALAGLDGLSLNAISREMGMTGPALYRYFPDRAALIDAVVIDGYADLGLALEAAVDPAAAPPNRIRALAQAYRGWATAQPHRYVLLMGTRAGAGGVNHDDVNEAGDRAMAAVFASVDGARLRASRTMREGTLAASLDAWNASRDVPGVPAIVSRAGIAVWSRLHGLVSLELLGHIGAMQLARDALFDDEVEALITSLIEPAEPVPRTKRREARPAAGST
jgi:AcrR family transcriptional regulator